MFKIKVAALADARACACYLPLNTTEILKACIGRVVSRYSSNRPPDRFCLVPRAVVLGKFDCTRSFDLRADVVVEYRDVFGKLHYFFYSLCDSSRSYIQHLLGGLRSTLSLCHKQQYVMSSSRNNTVIKGTFCLHEL